MPLFPGTNPAPLFVASFKDLVGVAGAPNNYFSVFNPLTSTKVLGFVQVLVQPYSVGANNLSESFSLYKITAASGGTLRAAADVTAFTPGTTPQAEVRLGNPTVTLESTVPIGNTPPPVSAGLGNVSPVQVPTPGPPLLCPPGFGVVFRTVDCDIDNRFDGSLFWVEL